MNLTDCSDLFNVTAEYARGGVIFRGYVQGRLVSCVKLTPEPDPEDAAPPVATRPAQDEARGTAPSRPRRRHRHRGRRGSGASRDPRGEVIPVELREVLAGDLQDLAAFAIVAGTVAAGVAALPVQSLLAAVRGAFHKRAH
jgi:hypothetical protein